MRKKLLDSVKDILFIILTVLVGCTGIVFIVLFIEKFGVGFIGRHKTLSIAFSVGVITVLTFLSIIFMKTKRQLIFKLFFIATLIIMFASFILYILNASGLLNKVKSVEDFRDYISSFGSFAVIVFILLQFSQVVILPLPGVITVGAGVLLFGPFKGAIFSCIGIITGSIVAFFIGRILGYKAVCWLVGKDNVDKWVKKIKGKDKVLLVFAFLFPFFPDDILCFISGITSITPRFFIITVIITRIISIFASSYSINNSIIPYNTWWGILLWGLFFAVTLLMSMFIYKKGDSLQKLFIKKKNQVKTNKN